MSDQILLILVYMRYTKKTGIWFGKLLFSLYQRYFQYQRLREMTIFDWYTTGIWHHGIRIMTFFFAVLLWEKFVVSGEVRSFIPLPKYF